MSRELNNIFVCSSCFENYYISDFIRKNGNRGACSFCENEWFGCLHANRLPIRQVYDFLLGCLQTQYEEPHPDFIPYDHEEHEFLDDGDFFGSILDENGAGCRHQHLEQLLNELASATFLAHRNSFVPTAGEFYSEHWRLFEDYVRKENTDALFDDSIESLLRRFSHLKSCVEYIANIVHIRRLSKRAIIYRARRRDTTYELVASELGTPPRTARATRFLPAGKAAFYGALDLQTAIAETIWPGDREIAVGEWSPNAPIFIADLSKVPVYGGVFDQNTNKVWEQLSFLNTFAGEIAKPTNSSVKAKDYYPTQIFFKILFDKLRQKREIHGMLYNSAKKNGGECLIISIPSRACVPKYTRVYSPPVRLILKKGLVIPVSA